MTVALAKIAAAYEVMLIHVYIQTHDILPYIALVCMTIMYVPQQIDDHMETLQAFKRYNRNEYVMILYTCRHCYYSLPPFPTYLLPSPSISLPTPSLLTPSLPLSHLPPSLPFYFLSPPLSV